MFSHRNAHQQVNIFNGILIEIISNFIPNKLVTFDNKDPPWIAKIKRKNKVETQSLQRLLKK